MSVASVLLSIMIALIPFIASRIVRGDIGSTLMTVVSGAVTAGAMASGLAFAGGGGLGRRTSACPRRTAATADRRARRYQPEYRFWQLKALLLGKHRTPAMEAPRLVSLGHQRLLPPRQAMAESAQLALQVVKILPLAEILFLFN